MTPTTVDAKIVAAAANAGHWAELAGGGQVTEPIFDARIAELTELLEPGRAVQFNTLFLDPYLWKLQVGGKRLVQKARQSGAPIDGVVVSAGIPELDEAVAIIEELNEIGIATCASSRAPSSRSSRSSRSPPRCPTARSSSTSRAAARVATTRGRTSTTCSLVDVRRPAQAAPTSRSASVAASARPSGPPSTCPGRGRQAYGFPIMPVDGILVGTAAMATLEATTSPAVKQLLVDTTGTEQWVGAGKAQGGMASGRSQLGADIHEIDNAASRCGRLLDDVAGDADAVAERRDEIIAAMADTAKPYFGDVADMTYLQWLRRYVELAIGDGDSTADTKRRRFAVAGRQLARPLRGDAQARRGPAASAGLRSDRDAVHRSTPKVKRCWRIRSARSRRCWPATPTPRPSSCTRPTCRSSSRCARRSASR